MIHLLPLATAFAAFLALALSMKRHQRDLSTRALTAARSRIARIAGWLLLALTWSVEAALLGPAMGTIVWFGQISAGAALAITTINWRGRTARQR